MANLRMTLLDLLNKSEQGTDPSFLRDGVQLLAQELMDAEVTDLVGAEPHQRTAGRTTYRNGYRDREWDTRVGTLDTQSPSSARAPTSRACWNLAAGTNGPCSPVVQEAHVHGVSTRAVDSLAEALGIKGISKDQVSRICKGARRPGLCLPHPGASTVSSPTSCWTPPSRRSERTGA